ncbi:MAG: riboflavin kinase [Acidimicrobiales bacterium]
MYEGKDSVLEGVVVHGDRRGRELGYPTANVELRGAKSPPSDGVYSGWCELEDGRRVVAAISVGTRPTYYNSQGARLVEAFLLDFDEDIYGKHVKLSFGSLVRTQARFANSDELVAQMRLDVAAVRAAATPTAQPGPSPPS